MFYENSIKISSQDDITQESLINNEYYVFSTSINCLDKKSSIQSRDNNIYIVAVAYSNDKGEKYINWFIARESNITVIDDDDEYTEKKEVELDLLGIENLKISEPTKPRHQIKFCKGVTDTINDSYRHSRGFGIIEILRETHPYNFTFYIPEHIKDASYIHFKQNKRII
ncbi:hypothetical protein C0Q44_27865 [Paenibacillus sp. PCH8]|uniref:hypothetical protein n=1 Tax=Paenibacillus sp. PCH8 TaxID=2066524 RepID=UPI000CF99DDF|nr:hypothetical protein [Paenibacillus sp. PCH8]PQP80236.1 hypothetical protein C0Q44_27865 [Paenibacillus sp. PCH8]